MKQLSFKSVRVIASLFGEKSFFRKAILAGTLATFAVTGTAQAQVNVTKLAPVPDGTAIVSGAINTGQLQMYWNGTAWVNIPAAGIGSVTDNNVVLAPPGNIWDAAAGVRFAQAASYLGQTFSIGGPITLTETGAAQGARVSGIVHSDWWNLGLTEFDGTINAQNITVTSSNNDAAGVSTVGYNDVNGWALSNGGIAAAGAINVKDVKVSTNGVQGWADGIEIAGNVAGTVTAGNIDVKSTNVNGGNATGFSAGGIDNPAFIAGSAKAAEDAASVKLGNVSASSVGGNATGIQVGGVSTTNIHSGKLTVGDITVKSSNGNATGADFRNGDTVWGYENTGTFAGPFSPNVKSEINPAEQNVKLGNIKVETNGAAGTRATGINLGNVGNSRLVIDHDVIAKSTNSTTLQQGQNPANQAVGILAGTGSQGIIINNGVDGKDVEITGERTWVDANNNVRHSYSSIALGGGNDGLLVLGDKHTNNGKVFAVNGVEGIVYETDAEYHSGSSFTFNNASTFAVADDKLVNIHGNLVSNNGATLNIGQLPMQDLSNPAVAGANTNYKGTLVVHHLTGNGGVNNDAFSGNLTLDSGKLAISGAYQNKVAGNVRINVDNPQLAQANPTVPPTLDARDGNPGLYIYGNTTVGTSALQANQIIGYNGALNAGMDTNHDGTIDSAELARQGIFSLSGISEYVAKTNALNSVIAQNRKTALLSDAYLMSAVLHNRLTGWSAARDRFISGTRKYRGVSGQAPCAPCSPICETECDPCEKVESCNPCDPCGKSFRSSSLARNTWVNYVGRDGKFNSSFAPIGQWKTGSDGIQVGTDIYKTSRNQIGLLFGYEDSWAKSGNTIVDDKVDADDTYFGIYAAHVLGNGADIRFVWTYGTQDYDLTRIDPSKLYPFHKFQTSFGGNTNEINLEIGKRFYSSQYVSFRPSIGIDFYSNDLKTAIEGSGSAVAFDDLHYQGARVGYLGTNWHQTFLRFGSDMKIEKGAFTLDSGLYYSYDVAGDELEALVGAVNTLSNANIANGTAAYSTLRSVNLGRSYLTVNIGGSLQLSKNLSVFGGYNGDFSLDKDSDAVSSTGYVGGIVKW